MSSVVLVLAAGTVGGLIGAQAPVPAPPQGGKEGRIAEWTTRSREFEAKGLADPFKGVTADGTVVPGLFAREVDRRVHGAGAEGGFGLPRGARRQSSASAPPSTSTIPSGGAG